MVGKIISLLLSFDANTDGKPVWRSKTMWTNVLALAGVMLSKYANIDLGTEDIAAVLATVNIGLRLVTKSSTGFYEG